MTKTPDILKDIVQRKTEEVAERSKIVTLRQMNELAEIADPVRGFIEAIETKINTDNIAIIVEIKKGSPSKGVLREQFMPANIAKSYEKNGAACLSVLTDRDFFQGNELDLEQAHEACSLPIIRKDFIIDPYQVYESRAISADCILLIISALQDEQLSELSDLAMQLDMDILVEVHNLNELERALLLNLPLIGINNRNLQNFETSLDTTLNLLPYIPDSHTIITESGIHSTEDVKLMQNNNVKCFLVGEIFIRATDPGAQLSKLFNRSSLLNNTPGNTHINNS